MALNPNVVVVAPGELITATHLNNIRSNLIRIDDDPKARGVVAYAQATADQSGITVESNLASCTAVFTAVAGRRYKVTAQATPRSTVAGDVAWLFLRDGINGTQLITSKVQLAFAAVGETANLSWVSIASMSGAKTFQLSMARIAGTGSLISGASVTDPTFIAVEDVGPL